MAYFPPLIDSLFTDSDARSAAGSSTPAPYQIIDRVHEDDIHGMFLHPQGIISGSKDTTVRITSLRSRSTTILSSPPRPTYKFWVTALDHFNDRSWIEGRRNGHIKCSELKGRQLNHYFKSLFHSDYSIDPPTSDQLYKERNTNRITGIRCLKEVSEEVYQILIGYPEKFYLFDLTGKTVLKSFHLPHPEWVYGFLEITPTVIGAIHGASLSFFQDDGKDSWDLSRSFIEFDHARHEKGSQIPFISHVEKIKETNAITIAYFGGTVQMCDIETGSVLHESREHVDRVWQALPLNPSCYLSCADDRTVKLWDIRSGSHSVKTYADHPGRVSSLCIISEHQFAAGTCPDDPKASEKKAQLYLYDERT